MIAFFGMGLLGSNFVRALRRRGEEVHVWNRTAARARELEAAGARAFDDPAEAARGAARLHLTLSDDAAVDALLEAARPGLAPGAIIVDHTTTSPTGTAARAARWSERGLAFLHAPVFMGPKHALEGTGLMLASGDPALYATLTPELARMTGKLLYLGPQPERAAGFKLLGNLYLMFINTAVADVLAFARTLGVAPRDAAALFETFNPGATIGERFERVFKDDFGNPGWKLGMARKDVRLILEETEAHGGSLAILPAIAAELDRWIERGHGGDDWTVIASDALRK